MKEAIKEIVKDLGRELEDIEISLIKISYYKGYSKGHNEATSQAIEEIKKLK